jgi:hypothetical protein
MPLKLEQPPPDPVTPSGLTQARCPWVQPPAQLQGTTSCVGSFSGLLARCVGAWASKCTDIAPAYISPMQ